MATPVGRSRVRGYRWAAGRPVARTPLLGLLPPLLILVAIAGTGLVVARTSGPRTVSVAVDAVSGGAPSGTPTELKAAAADLLEATTAKDGAGYRFEIVQRSTLQATADGPLIEVADPADPTRTTEADTAYQLGVVETGYVTPAGFYAELREGPASPEAKVDLAAGELMYRTLVRENTTYRDDGEGWYPTDRPPGIGLDPATAALLPTLLRDAEQPKDADLAASEGELGAADPAAARALSATTTVADIPGIVAVDGAPFTELTDPVALTFDDAGRLSGILVSARNTNVTAYDLVMVTEIAIRYDEVPASLPRPDPAYAGDDRPVVEP